MILTTSRDPSRRSRSFARVLSKFMNWKYIQRGKRSFESLFDELSDNEKLAVINEIKGNPAILKLYGKDGKEILSLRINVGEIKREKMGDEIVFFLGKPPFDPLLFEVMPPIKPAKKFIRKIRDKKIIKVKENQLEFIYKGKRVLKIKIVGVKYGGGDRG